MTVKVKGLNTNDKNRLITGWTPDELIWDTSESLHKHRLAYGGQLVSQSNQNNVIP
jgi:hypothetical protein